MPGQIVNARILAKEYHLGPYTKNYEGKTPLDLAIETGRYDVIPALCYHESYLYVLFPRL